MKDKIIIIGASGHGKVVADIAKLNGYSEISFLDDDVTKKINGIYQVVGTTQDIGKYKDDYDFFIAIGNNEIRKKISLFLYKNGIKQAILIHPTAVIDKTVKIEEGTIIMANAVINAETVIGRGCIINTASSIDHDCVIQDYVHISPGVHLAGTVCVGDETWIGIGANIINNLSITSKCIIGAGSVVINDINISGVYFGNPAREKSKVSI